MVEGERQSKNFNQTAQKVVKYREVAGVTEAAYGDKGG